MKTVIYIVGQSYCGSTALGYALGNHDNIKFLGETKQWMYGRILRDADANVNFKKPPDIDYVVDSSKSIWRLRQWKRTKYDVKVIWLKKSLLKLILSRIKRKPPGNLFYWITVPILARIVNRIYLLKQQHIKVSLNKLQTHDKETQEKIERYVGTKLPHLYKRYYPEAQPILSGNMDVTKTRWLGDIYVQ